VICDGAAIMEITCAGGFGASDDEKGVSLHLLLASSCWRLVANGIAMTRLLHCFLVGGAFALLVGCAAEDNDFADRKSPSTDRRDDASGGSSGDAQARNTAGADDAGAADSGSDADVKAPDSVGEALPSTPAEPTPATPRETDDAPPQRPQLAPPAVPESSGQPTPAVRSGESTPTPRRSFAFSPRTPMRHPENPLRSSPGPSPEVAAMKMSSVREEAPDLAPPEPAPAASGETQGETTAEPTREEAARPLTADPPSSSHTAIGEGQAAEQATPLQSAAGEKAAAAKSEDYSVVEVFYGTDRRAVTGDAAEPVGWLRFAAPSLAAVAALTCLMLALRIAHRRLALGALAVVAALISAGLFWHEANNAPSARGAERAYGNQRGELEMGICEVTIPKSHEQGRLESPSILRLEVRENAARHVVLRSVESRSDDAFFQELHAAVARSPQREALIFIHGYNVSFEDAARRTGQMAHDLKLKGAPIFYSWPSQGGLLKYTVDETNVVWTVPHLKRFLLDVVRRSDARSVNLIAHSMGNRALTAALRELEFELAEDSRMFNQIVLAAPDIDAEIFRRDIAPAITKTARGVTLYASSKDRALAASKKVHGYPRAGESRPHLTVLPDIETIDVSQVDTSLLGHSYYGGSRRILDDIGVLIRENLPASRRNLAPTRSEGMTYWVLRDAVSDSRRGAGGSLR
jgi:esterase/lipase superfamily enzyme